MLQTKMAVGQYYFEYHIRNVIAWFHMKRNDLYPGQGRIPKK